jgi:hypothetical protein
MVAGKCNHFCCVNSASHENENLLQIEERLKKKKKKKLKYLQEKKKFLSYVYDLMQIP